MMRRLKSHISVLWITLLFAFSSGSPLSAQVQDITQDGESVRIPFQTHQDFIIIRATIFGNLELNLIFDTGAQHTILFNRIYTDIFGVEYDRRIPIYGADLSRELHALIAHNIPVKAAPSKPKNMSILVLEEDHSVLDQLLGKSVHGLLGASFFADYIVEINYRRNYIKLHHRSSFKQPGSNYHSFPIEVINNKPYVKGNVRLNGNDRTPLRFLLDTGAGLPLLLHSNTHPDLEIPENAISGQLGAGLGGYLKGYLSRVPGLELWDHQFGDIVTNFQDIDTMAIDFRDLNREGIIGNQLLNRFHLYINYTDEVIHLRPERNFDEPFRYNKSGISVIAAGPELNRFYIANVAEKSPAWEAGLRRGDRIVAFQRWPSSFMSLRFITNRLERQEGNRIRVRVEREEDRQTHTFRLRELF
ncbi:MAG: PDZ domain-containing protein [Saprospirales bacterium]|nr:MAG: PDZ domain-containing protein [Saprospirales bacterium]